MILTVVDVVRNKRRFVRRFDYLEFVRKGFAGLILFEGFERVLQAVFVQLANGHQFQLVRATQNGVQILFVTHDKVLYFPQ